MSMRKIIKSSLISLAVLGMIGGSINSNVANAKHRHVHYTRRIKRARRHSKRNRLYRHHGRIRYSYERRHRSYKRNRHAKRYHTAKKRHISKKMTFHFNPRKDKETKADREYDKIVYGKNYLPSLKKYDELTHSYHSKDSRAFQNYRENSYYHPSKSAINESSNDGIKNANQLKSRTLVDINNSRQKRGLAPLQESNELDDIASMRSKQLDTGFNTSNPHIDPNTGYSYADEDGYKLGYSNSPSDRNYGENAAECILGSNTNGEGHTFTATNGKSMADEAEQNMINYDQDEGNGHRDNILNPGYTSYGVGAHYNPKSQTYNLAEEFKY